MRKIIHIVDDDASVRGATSFLLSSHGYSPRIYESGTEFLQQADLEEGCALLDLRMSDMSGLDVLEALIEADAGLPVIMLTGHGDVATAVQALKLGATDFIQKPYDEADLIAAIERAFASGHRESSRKEAKRAALERLERLSPRETQVLRGLLCGMTNKEMARLLELSPRTVEMHRSTMMADLGVDAAADAIRIAIAAELEPLDESRSVPVADPVAARPARTPFKLPPPAGVQPLDRILPPVLDALEASTDGAILLDRGFDIVFANKEAVAMIKPKGEMVGANLWKLFPATRQTDAFKQLRRAADDGVSVRFDFYCPDIRRWLAVKAAPTPGGLQVSFRDLTNERMADAAVRQSEERLRLALEAAGDGAWDWDIAKGRFHISSCYVERLVYGEEATIAGLGEIWRLIHPDDQPTVKAKMEEHLAGRSDSFVCEYRIRSGDGQWRWSLDRGRVVERDAVSGAPTRMVGTSTDITMLKSMKRIVAEANARIAMAQECAGAGLWDYDVRTGVIQLCARSRAMFGLPESNGETLEISAWKKVIHPDDLAATLIAFDRAVRTGEPYSARYRVLRPDGTLRWIRGTGKAAGRVAGRTVRMIGLNLDETEQMQAVDRLERLQADLLDVGRANAAGTMAAALADELNQPLTAVLNYVQGLKLSMARALPARSSGLPPELPEALERTEESAREATLILRRIRDKARAHRLRRQPEPLSAMIEEAARVALAGTESAGIRLAISVAPEAARVLVDRIQIQQVIINLVRNAAEAMAEVEGDREIAIHAELNARGKVEVSVNDRGTGLPDELVDQLFFPFVSTKERNAGIGLAVSRNIVEAHGGRIWAEPAPGGGTSIGFTLEPVTSSERQLHEEAA
jgi:two-component system sensor kinase FixL